MRKLGIPKIAIVIWHDCQTIDGWHVQSTALEMGEEDRVIRSVGFILSDTKEQIILAGSIEAVFGSVCQSMIIPRSQIKRVSYLPLPEACK